MMRSLLPCGVAALLDSRRIVTRGWSHGASTALSDLNAARPSFARNVAAAILFYPGCSTFLKEPFPARAAALAEIDTCLATRRGASLNAASPAAGVPTLR